MTSSLRRRLALALSGAAVLAAGAAVAQISRNGGPIGIGSDDFELDQNAGRISYIGRAEATQDSNRLRANRLDAYFEGEGGNALAGGVDRIEAVGEVYFVTPEQVARGDRAVFDVGASTLTVTGDVILSQGRNVMTGSRLVYNTETGQARMEGGQTPGGRRVQGVFYPDQQN